MARRTALLLVVVAILFVITDAAKLPIRKRVLTMDEISTRLNARKRDALPMGGSIGKLGLFYVDISVGGQPLRVSLDTGSSTLYVASTKCVDTDTSMTCDHVNPYYDPSKSSESSYYPCTNWCELCQEDHCGIATSYADNSSVKAFEMTDRVAVGSQSVVAHFGSLYSVSGYFLNKLGIDGLWGLAYSALSSIEPVFDAFVRTGQMQNVFSMCLNDDGGVFVVGELDTSYQTGTQNWVPLVSQTFYSIQLKGIKVGSTVLSIRASQTIVDSGTTLMAFPTSVYTQVVNEIRRDCSLAFVGCGGGPSVFDLDKCWSISLNQRNAYPTLTIVVQGSSGLINLDIPPSSYFVPTVSTNGAPCYFVGFQASADDSLTLGDVFMRPYHVIFDRANSRVGFASVNHATCTSQLAPLEQLSTVPATNPTGVNVVAIAVSVTVVVLLVFGGTLLGIFLYLRYRARH